MTRGFADKEAHSVNTTHPTADGSKRPSAHEVKEPRENPGWKADDGLRVVLFDLDGTLFNSEAARNERWPAALSHLEGVTKRNKDVLLTAYRELYDCHADITSRVGARGHVFEDIRQAWNTRISYALLIAWCEHDKFPHEEKDADPAAHRKALRQLRNDDEWQSFLDKAEEISDPWNIKYAVSIDQARSSFWQGDWSHYLYPGITNGLRKLRKKGIKYCIATEGHLPTQWRKICAIGLAGPGEEGEWFMEGQLLATSQAARPDREIRALNDLIAWYRGRAAASREAASVFSPDSTSAANPRLVAKVSDLQLEADAVDLIATGLARIAKLLERLATKLYQQPVRDQPAETQPEFYSRVLYAINQSPEDPRRGLMQWDLSWREDAFIRVAVVGDNLAKDIFPILALSRNLDRKMMAIWVRQGRHGRGTSVQQNPVHGTYRSCESIGEVFHRYLLNDEEWNNQTQVLSRPPALFASAIESKVGEPTQEEINALLAGVAGARDVLGSDLRYTLGPRVVADAHRFVEKVFATILQDIRDSKTRHVAIEKAMVICREMRNSSLFLKIPGLPQTAVDFVLFLVGSNSEDREILTYVLTQLSPLLQLKEPDWAAAMIRALSDQKNIIEQIRMIDAVVDEYRSRLKVITESPLIPKGFPIREAGVVYAELGPCARSESARARDQGSARHSLGDDSQRTGVFISYSTHDQEFAERLHTDLQAEGVRCWIAPHDIHGGRKIHEQIKEAIRLYDRLLLILSEHSMKSDWVRTAVVSENIPQRIGDYEIIRELGHGGMGKVYQVRNVLRTASRP